MMLNRDLWDTVKRLVEQLSSDSYKDLGRIDPAYNQKLWEQYRQLEEAYNQLPIADKEVSVIESFLKVREDIDIENLKLAFMAGMMTCIELLDKMEMLEI